MQYLKSPVIHFVFMTTQQNQLNLIKTMSTQLYTITISVECRWQSRENWSFNCFIFSTKRTVLQYFMGFRNQCCNLNMLWFKPLCYSICKMGRSLSQEISRKSRRAYLNWTTFARPKNSCLGSLQKLTPLRRNISKRS